MLELVIYPHLVHVNATQSIYHYTQSMFFSLFLLCFGLPKDICLLATKWFTLFTKIICWKWSMETVKLNEKQSYGNPVSIKIDQSLVANLRWFLNTWCSLCHLWHHCSFPFPVWVLQTWKKNIWTVCCNIQCYMERLKPLWYIMSVRSQWADLSLSFPCRYIDNCIICKIKQKWF